MKLSDTESLNIPGKILLFAGVGVVIAFAYFINGKFLVDAYVNWDLINALLLWLIFVILVILVNKEHIEEIKILRQISQEQLKEIKLLRKETTKKKR
jgi:hypothetical protein